MELDEHKQPERAQRYSESDQILYLQVRNELQRDRAEAAEEETLP